MIEQKLESLRRCLQRVAEKCPPDPETLRRDPDQLKKAVGLCNIVVHNYQETDWTILHTIARHHLGNFTEFVRAIASGKRGRTPFLK